MKNMEYYKTRPLGEAWAAYKADYDAGRIEGCVDFTEWLVEYEPVKDAEQMIRQALVGTIYENAGLTEYGGGDGAEDIKPFLIDTKGGIDLGATVYPEGGMLFWTWPEDGNQEETENAADAIAAFQKATDNK